jgi:hypothetical protein
VSEGQARHRPGDEGMRQPGERPSYETPETVLELQPSPEPATERSVREGRVHLVVVMTRAVSPADNASQNAVIVSRFWHPSLHRWSENSFESLEHALHLFVDESGWVLRQQQSLDAPHAYELIFEARREDFSRPSTEAMLEDVGLTAEDVADLMERVDRENGPDERS